MGRARGKIRQVVYAPNESTIKVRCETIEHLPAGSAVCYRLGTLPSPVRGKLARDIKQALQLEMLKWDAKREGRSV